MLITAGMRGHHFYSFLISSSGFFFRQSHWKTLKRTRLVTFNHLDRCSVLDALNGAQLCEAVQRGAVQLEGETCAMAGELVLHQHSVQLCHQQLARHLRVERGCTKKKRNKNTKWLISKTVVTVIRSPTCSSKPSAPGG